MPAAAQRYTAVAIVLHWAIALALVGNALLGWWMGGAIEDVEAQRRAIAAFQLHKSLGLAVLALTLLRLAWRLAHRPPALPGGMPRWERLAAGASHWAFYALTLALPLSGWVFVSAQWRDGAPLNIPTMWFGLFEVPHLFGLHHADVALRAALSRGAGEVHQALAWGGAGLLALHVAAALKHQWLDRDAVMARMMPRWAPGEHGRAGVLVVGLGAAAIGAAAIGVALLRVPLGSVAFALVEEPAGASGGAVLATPRAGTWTFSPDHGSVLFRGTHAGAVFKGAFTRWSARVQFDPADPAGSRLEARIDTGSATDGISMHDEALAQAEWFNVARYPEASYASTRMVPVGEGRYRIEGILGIKDRYIAVPLELGFTATGVSVTGRFVVDRALADLGMASDPDAEWVSREIEVTVRAAGLPGG